jgi:CHAT domain-containing protein
MDPVDSRNRWLDGLVARLGAPLAKDGLDPALDLSELGGADLTRALVLASAATSHSGGEFLDETAERISPALGEGVEPLEVALRCLRTYRRGGIDVPDWWDAGGLFVALAESWADRALAGATSEEVEAVMRDRWRVPHSVATELAAGLNVSACTRSAAMLAEASGGPLARLQELDAGKEAIAEGRESLSPPFDQHALLVELAGALGASKTLATVARRLRQEGTSAKDLLELENTSASLIAAIEADTSCLTHLEVGALQPPDADAQLLRDAVAATKRRIYMTALGEIGLVVPNGISEKVEDLTLASDALRDEIFSAGARSGIDAVGPTAYMWLALERHELPEDRDFSGFRLEVPVGSEVPFELELAVAPGSDAARMSYRFGHTDETRRWLAMAVLSGQVTVDLFELDKHGGVELILRASYRDPGLENQLRERALIALRENELEHFLAGMTVDNHVLAGFGVSENAKSELLVELANDANSDDEAVRAARRRLLDAEISRAWKLYANVDPSSAEREVEAARRGYVDTRPVGHNRGARHMSEDPLASHRAVVGEFARDRRAALHFNVKEGRIEGFWTADGGDSRGWLSCQELDTAALAHAARPWIENARGDVAALLEASRPIAVEVEEALGDHDVEELIICPWSTLNGVPFAAIPLGEGTLGDRFRISYAPSLALLHPLLEAGPEKQGINLVSAHNGSLGWADAEIAAAQVIHPAAQVTPDRSEREAVLAAIGGARLLHLASHGLWWRDDPFASGLDLRLGGPFDRYVSAAEVHRDLDLRGAELVLLAACDTGRSPSLRHGVETYSGIDAAFLAKGARSVVSALWPVNDLAAALFMTVLHIELAAGTPLPLAFGGSVEFLREEKALRLTAGEPVSIALDASGRDWRAAVQAAAGRFADPVIWAAFKISGVPWLSQPLPDGGGRRAV